MKLKKPNFWDYKKPNLISYSLYPISIVLKFIIFLRKKFIKKNNFKGIKKICVGNMYLGGTGKTSLSLEIFKILKENNKKVCFIKKYYSNQLDEHKLLENCGKLFKERKRNKSIENAIKENYEFAIFDDGLQDFSIHYDFKIICFNNINWIGNGLTIPSGPLRESFDNLKKYEHVFINGNLENVERIKNEILSLNPKIKIHFGKYVPLNLDRFNLKKKYLAFSGIGNHQTFLSMLKINGFNVLNNFEFPDHYNYSQNDLDKIIDMAKKDECEIITTEKDFLRIGNLNKEKINFIKSELKIIEKEKIINEILNLNE